MEVQVKVGYEDKDKEKGPHIEVYKQEMSETLHNPKKFIKKKQKGKKVKIFAFLSLIFFLFFRWDYSSVREKVGSLIEV